VSEALRALVAEAARVVPGLNGRVVTSDAAAPWHAGTGLSAVQHFWASRYPEAGPHYAALRGWGLLVWQPIYVAVIAAHLGDAQPDLDCLSLVVDDGDVSGYRFGTHSATSRQNVVSSQVSLSTKVWLRKRKNPSNTSMKMASSL